jgi:hypothetical protein
MIKTAPCPFHGGKAIDLTYYEVIGWTCPDCFRFIVKLGLIEWGRSKLEAEKGLSQCPKM